MHDMRTHIWLRPPALALGLLLAVAGCGEETAPTRPPEPGPEQGPPAAPPRTLLSLGDSYTVAHGLPAAWGFPAQLADSLAARGDTLVGLGVVAATGWTSADLLAALRDTLAAVPAARGPHGVVTVMIGVNDQHQERTPAAFAADLDTLLDLAVELAGDDPARVVGLTIPDWGATPVGGFFDRAAIAAEIDAFNAVLTAALAARGIACADVVPLSRQVDAEPGLLAKDGLHYSREMYRRWTVRLLPPVTRALGP